MGDLNWERPVLSPHPVTCESEDLCQPRPCTVMVHPWCPSALCVAPLLPLLGTALCLGAVSSLGASSLPVPPQGRECWCTRLSLLVLGSNLLVTQELLTLRVLLQQVLGRHSFLLAWKETGLKSYCQHPGWCYSTWEFLNVIYTTTSSTVLVFQCHQDSLLPASHPQKRSGCFICLLLNYLPLSAFAQNFCWLSSSLF